MKRMLSIIMLLFFLMSVSGVNVNIHYCDSELVGMTVNGIHLRPKPDRKWLIVAMRIQAVRCVSMSRIITSCTSNSCKAARHRCILCSWPTIGFMA